MSDRLREILANGPNMHPLESAPKDGYHFYMIFKYTEHKMAEIIRLGLKFTEFFELEVYFDDDEFVFSGSAFGTAYATPNSDFYAVGWRPLNGQ